MNKPGLKQIFVFWAPLALTWLMMSMEGPFLAAVVARLEGPKVNLAAHGIAFAIAILIEAPVIMIMSASTALAGGRQAYLKLRNFTFFLNGAITLFMAVLILTPAMDYILRDIIFGSSNGVGNGVSPEYEEIIRLTITALFIMLPWPGAIGYRRFYQGLLIRGGQTRKVAYSTVIRLIIMGTTGYSLYAFTDLPGACVSASALTAGVVVEALVVRFMSRGVVRILLEDRDPSPTNSARSSALSYRGITRFYYPLALTSTIALIAHPMVTFFVGKGRFPLESLAVIPVVNSLVFIFRAIGLSFQEAAIALMGENFENYRALRRFALILGLGATACLALIAFTPLSRIWFEDLSGLSPALSGFAVAPAMILSAIPALSVLLSFQRAILVKGGRTPPLTWATILEVGGTIVLILLFIHGLDMIGATAAALALLLGRVLGNLYLIRPCMNR